MNTAGIIDLVPQAARRRWREDGSYPNRDVFDLFRERARETPAKPAVLSPRATSAMPNCWAQPCAWPAACASRASLPATWWPTN